VSAARYDSLLAIYQAQNAVQIARSQGAEQYAGDTLAKAESLLSDARRLEAQNAGRSAVVTAARQAAQTAEDARAIAAKRSQETELAEARATAAQERERREAAERAARQAQIQASEQQTKVADDNIQRQKAEAEAESVIPPTPAERESEARKSEARVRLMQRMNTYFTTADTPRGLMVTLHDRDFRGAALDPAIAARLANLAATIAAQPALRIEVDGHGEQFSSERASAVRDTLVRAGMQPRNVAAQGLGLSRPLVSATTPNGREQNRRVEIVVTGDSIGSLAHWDHSYSVR
jgi:outer membrane protein OmpA-like peptidoglycan-associated protein